ncbi:hypothetical protein Vafri_13243 [Volvox africanus]|uniref:Uncharacterized protein n=2 Tax=Volvox africanus TaxID=51714 RepID=A0A8J4F3C7_9CHLO|nr:hypothetical protein Vafri_13243 [Volvox africanus]
MITHFPACRRPANDYNNKKRTWRPNKDAVWKACAAKSVKAWEENIKPGLVAAYDPFMAHGDNYSTQLETSLRAAGVPEAMLIDLVVGVSDTFHTSTKILQAAGVPLDAVVKQAYGAGAPEVRNDFSMEGDPQQQCKPKQHKQQPPTEPQDVGTRQVLQPPKAPQQGLQIGGAIYARQGQVVGGDAQLLRPAGMNARRDSNQPQQASNAKMSALEEEDPSDEDAASPTMSGSDETVVSGEQEGDCAAKNEGKGGSCGRGTARGRG